MTPLRHGVAAPRGLLAWEDPSAEDGPASPFWVEAPMAAGLPGRADSPPFAALVRKQGGAVSGLRLLDGALILKVERDGAAGQVGIEDGAAFDPTGGLGLFLPWGDDHMSRELARAGELVTGRAAISAIRGKPRRNARARVTSSVRPAARSRLVDWALTRKREGSDGGRRP